MATNGNERLTALQLLTRMFDAEMSIVRSDHPDFEALANAFHRDVVVHEPASLPYAGDWRGLDGVGALFLRMRQVWSEMDVRALQAARSDDIVFMSCTLRLTSRATGIAIEQPFAEVLRFEDDRLIEGTPFYFDTAEIGRALQNRLSADRASPGS
jgi:ketosteroid isomerase-like protein